MADPAGVLRTFSTFTSATQSASFGSRLVSSRTAPAPAGDPAGLSPLTTGSPPPPLPLLPGVDGPPGFCLEVPLPPPPPLLPPLPVVLSSSNRPPKWGAAAPRPSAVTTPSTLPPISVVLGFPFFGAAPSSPSARDLPGDLRATAVPPACPARLARPPASASSGDSTTKRYLHFGQSTFFPIREAFLMVTDASQLGHWTLNPVVVAIQWLRKDSARMGVGTDSRWFMIAGGAGGMQREFT